MKSLKNFIGLWNRNRLEKAFVPLCRLYSDQKVENPPIEKQLTEPMQTRYKTVVEDDFRNGVSITSYNIMGFRLNRNVQVIGPIIVFPHTVLSWNIEDVKAINADSLMLFALIQPRIETLIIGVGESEPTEHIGKHILEFSVKHNINVEILTSELACTQFNLLAGEGRMVAAALIPPCSVRDGDSDMYDTLSLDNKLFTIDNLHSEDLAPLKNTKK